MKTTRSVSTTLMSQDLESTGIKGLETLQTKLIYNLFFVMIVLFVKGLRVTRFQLSIWLNVVELALKETLNFNLYNTLCSQLDVSILQVVINHSNWICRLPGRVVYNQW